MSTFTGERTDFTGDIDNVLIHEADRIGYDIHRENVHTSPWIDLTPKGVFPEGMGYRMQSLIYERSLPTNAAGDTLGLTWGDFTASSLVTGRDNSVQVQGANGLLNGSTVDTLGPLNNQSAGGADVPPAHIDWQKRLEPYSLQRATVQSPEINVEELRFAAHQQEQLTAAFDALAEGVRYSWEERYRDEYQRVARQVVECLSAGTDVSQTTVTGGDASDRFDNGVPNANVANISNAVLDRIYNKLVRSGGGRNPWGRENGRPVFGLVCSSEASYQLMTESEIRTDVRESSRVDELLAPLGVMKGFRGFYHIVDDLAPRYRAADGDAGYTAGDYVRIEPFTIASNVVVPNGEYESTDAKYEVAYVLHKEVMCSLIPNPVAGVKDAKFDPVDYSGKFHWLNIKSVDLNPLGTVGHFLGVLASATKPLKTQFGFALIYDRTSTTAAT